MKYKTSKIKFLRIMVLLITVSFVVFFFGIILNHPIDTKIESTIRNFYKEEDNSLDYVVLGSSAAQRAVSPKIVEDESSLKGYDLCVEGGKSNIYLSMLKEIIDHQRRATIVVDMDGFYDPDFFNQDSYDLGKYWIDSMPHNRNWIDTIEKVDPERRMEHYFPIIRYHKNPYNLMELIKTTYMMRYLNCEKETKGSKETSHDINNFYYNDSLTLIDFKNCKEMKIDERQESILIEFLEYCRKERINNIIFVDFPKTISSKNDISIRLLGYYKYCEKIIDKYGYQAYSYNENINETNINEEDFNGPLHLVKSGMNKISIDFANVLKLSIVN